MMDISDFQGRTLGADAPGGGVHYSRQALGRVAGPDGGGVCRYEHGRDGNPLDLG